MFSFAQIITVSSLALAAAASPMGNGLIRRDTNITGTHTAVPDQCSSVCNGYQSAVASCQGETVEQYNNASYVGPDFTKDTLACICGDNIATKLATCLACTGNNADAGTNVTFVRKIPTILESYNSACISFIQDGYLNGTWTNTTLNFTGGLHGKGNAVGSGVSRRTEFMFGATGLGLVGAIIAVLA